MGFSISCFNRVLLSSLFLSWHQAEGAVSAELFFMGVYKYGKFEARLQMPPHMGVLGGFSLWPLESPHDGKPWYEMDIEKVGYGSNGHCQLRATILEAYGKTPPAYSHKTATDPDVCEEYFKYTIEWTDSCIKFYANDFKFAGTCGLEARRFKHSKGMRMHFNIWHGEDYAAGKIDTSLLPMYMFVDWVRYSRWNGGDSFSAEWVENFQADYLPFGWGYGEYPDDKEDKRNRNNATATTENTSFGFLTPHKTRHSRKNVFFTRGAAVLALADDDHPVPLLRLYGGAAEASNGTVLPIQQSPSLPGISSWRQLQSGLLTMTAGVASVLVATVLCRSSMNLKRKVPETDAEELLGSRLHAPM